MITRVQIKNYRSIESVDVHLEPMTVLVGRNGSGKSSFVDAIKLVRDSLRVGLENAIIERHGFGSICRHSGEGKQNFEIALTVESDSFFGTYELELTAMKDGFKIVREKAYSRTKISLTAGNGSKRVVQEMDMEEGFERKGNRWTSKPNTGLPARLERDFLESTVSALPTFASFLPMHQLTRHLSGNFYTIFPNTLRLPQKPMNEQILSDYGDNFGSVLQHLMSKRDTKREIIAVLSRIVEGVSDVRVHSAGGFLIAELQHQDLVNDANPKRKSAPWFDLSQESDGTVRMLGLLTALYQRTPNAEKPLLALEEPEIALHPGALAVLADELQAASTRRPLLVTTQSPDLIARFDAKNLRVVEKIGGVTHIGPIEESQRQVIEDQLFNAGDLLRIEGLRGARPTDRELAMV